MTHLYHADPKVVTKPWGQETWHVLSRDFCVKTIKLLKGHKTSFQWHRQKEEINFIRAGTAEVWVEDEGGVIQKHILTVGDSFFVPVTRKHRVIALTDLEMFEVSNEFVDDVVRINDEFGRGDGKIEAEHQVPAVLILAAGLGSRLKHLTASKNKALIPINNKAIISHIIDRFPVQYEIVVALGYQGDSLKSYCELAHPERHFHFVQVDKWDDPKTDPGYSALACSQYLQRPFYLSAVDCLIEEEVPHMDGNWIGVYPTDYPEKYATVQVVGDRVAAVLNKSPTGFDQAFIGLAAIFDYSIFWTELARAGGELVAAWKDVTKYPTLKAKSLKWFDTGNLDDLNAARVHLHDEPLSSYKTLDEVIYHVDNKVLKFHSDPAITTNRFARGQVLGNLAPSGLESRGQFLVYNWQAGANLYKHDSPDLYRRFLGTLDSALSTNPGTWFNESLVRSFYADKTAARLGRFELKYGSTYLTTSFNINGRQCAPLRDLLSSVSYTSLSHSPLYPLFHGDLHFDNVIYDEKGDRFVYIDWRESFGGETDGGDLYYDLGKLYAGCLVPFELLKDDSNVTLSEGSSTVIYNYQISTSLRAFTREYENWLSSRHYNLEHVRLVAALAFLNIAPLHSHIWNKILLFEGIRLLDDLIS